MFCFRKQKKNDFCFTGGLTSTGISAELKKEEEVRRKRHHLMFQKCHLIYNSSCHVSGHHRIATNQCRARNEYGAYAEKSGGKESQILFKVKMRRFASQSCLSGSKYLSLINSFYSVMFWDSKRVSLSCELESCLSFR